MSKPKAKHIKRSRLLKWLEARKKEHAEKQRTSTNAEEVRYYSDIIEEVEQIHRAVRKGHIE